MIVVARQPTERFTPTRYDRQLREAALAAISNSKYAALKQLDCKVTDGVVEITGTVSSFYLKQLAQAAVMQLDGVESVKNLVTVSGESPVVVAKSCV
jgi:osmotically-inducible protein OsmY